MIDRDGNGMLFEEELAAYGKMIATAQLSRISLEVADQGNKLFDILDANHDQRLTSRELLDGGKRIADWDADDDQQVSPLEFPHHWQLSISQGPPNSRPTTIFANAASMRGQQSGPPSDPAWFQKMDRNRDGDVSKREFLGPLNDFQHMDEDGDGLLSLAEAVNLPTSR